MNAAVVELNALADAVGPSTQDHDLAPAAARGPIGSIVCRVIVEGILHPAYRYRLPALNNSQGLAPRPDLSLWDGQKLREVSVCKAIFFGLTEKLIWEIDQWFTLVGQYLFFQLDQFLHLLEEPGLDMGQLIELLDVGTLSDRFIENELPLA